MNQIEFGKAYDTGIDIGVYQDAVYAATVTTFHKVQLSVGVVAEGRSKNETDAAKLVLARIHQYLERSKQKDLQLLVQGALLRAHKALHNRIKKSGIDDLMSASATIVAIHQSKLYLAQVGTTAAYLIRDGKTQKLESALPATDMGTLQVIGAPLPPEPEEPTPTETARWHNVGWQPIELKQGDVVVLATDGLTAEVAPDSGRMAVNPEEMPAILSRRDIPALEIARTLVSLAIGRKAPDNVSVAVLKVPKPQARKRLSYLAVAVAALFVFVVVFLSALFVGGMFDPEPTATPTLPPTSTPLPTEIPDVGRIGHVSTLKLSNASADMVVSQYPSPAIGTPIEVHSSEYALFNLFNEPIISAIIGPESEIVFERVNLTLVEEGEPDIIIRLIRGAIYLPDVKTHNVIVEATLGGLPVKAEVGSGGATGTMLVESTDNAITVTCLSGACSLHEESVVGQSILELASEQPIRNQDYELNDTIKEWCGCSE